MNTVVLLGTAHSIQRGENAPTVFGAVLRGECEKYNIKAIAEEIDNDKPTVAYMLAKTLHVEHLFADPDLQERAKRGIQSDCSYDIIQEYRNRYPGIGMWPDLPSEENLPEKVWSEYDRRTKESHGMREQVWLEKIIQYDQWPLLFICGANHFRGFFNLLRNSGFHVIESHEDWAPLTQ
ncbi:MAG: hypothetical protein E8D52_12890 [Nitrospira sp.]|nr:MAG: hypothetical protein E8D52_12890 [Nitrospira sp.]